jgi:hypothetical protein
MLMSPSTYQHYVYLMSQEDPEAVVTPTFETKQIYKVEETIKEPDELREEYRPNYLASRDW